MQIVSLQQILSKWPSDVLLLALFIHAVLVASNIFFYDNHVIRNFISNEVFCILARVTQRLSVKTALKYYIRIEAYKICKNKNDIVNADKQCITNLIVAPCIFVESLQFINQQMHI